MPTGTATPGTFSFRPSVLRPLRQAYMGMSANGNGGRYHCYGGLVRLIAGAWELSGVPTLLLPGLGQVDLGVVVGGVAGRLGRPVDQV